MIVIPMAGRSRRFYEAGYDKPKFMLEAYGRSLFDHAVMSFERYFDKEQFLFVMRDLDEAPAFVESGCRSLGLKDHRIVVLAEPTEGQAETVALGLNAVRASDDAPLTIFNIDTFRPGFKQPDSFDFSSVDGYLEVFNGEGDHWSFALPAPGENAECRVAEVAEKKRISNLCSTGLYYFAKAGLFREAYEVVAATPADQLQGGERYVAPLYNRLIRQGRDIRYRLISPNEVIFCGTPEEYTAFLSRARERGA